jgi:hypothetical protein
LFNLEWSVTFVFQYTNAMNNLEEFCKLELIDGIVHAKYADDVYVELPTAKAIVKERRRIANNQPHSVLVTGGQSQFLQRQENLH